MPQPKAKYYVAGFFSLLAAGVLLKKHVYANEAIPPDYQEGARIGGYVRTDVFDAGKVIVAKTKQGITQGFNEGTVTIKRLYA